MTQTAHDLVGLGAGSSRRFLGVAVPVVAFVVLGWCWAIASPPGSAADDDFHMASIWCAWGPSDTCIQDDETGQILLPERLVNASCFALQGGQSASCALALTDEFVPSERVNPSFGSYPPIYYSTMRVFAGPDIARSVVIMRMVNVLLAGLLLAFALALARPATRRAVALSWMVALVPVGSFFIASMNPSSWAITGGALFWVFLLTWAQEPSLRSRRAILAALGALVCTVIAVGARSDSAYVILLSMFAVAAISASRWRSRPHILWVGVAAVPLVVVAAIFSVGRYLQFSPAFPPGNAETDQPNALLKLLLEIPTILWAIVGGQAPSWSQRSSAVDAQLAGFSWPGYTTGVGWTDAQNPHIAAVLTLLCIGGVIFLGLRSYSLRKVIALTILVIGLTAQIVFMRSLVAFQPVWFLQPRYFFALALVTLGFFVLSYPVGIRLINVGQSWLLVVALALAYSTSLLAIMGRYTYGQDHSWTGISAEPGWWWSGGPSPLIVAIVGTVSALAWLVGCSRIARAPRGVGWSTRKLTGST